MFFFFFIVLVPKNVKEKKTIHISLLMSFYFFPYRVLCLYFGVFLRNKLKNTQNTWFCKVILFFPYSVFCMRFSVFVWKKLKKHRKDTFLASWCLIRSKKLKEHVSGNDVSLAHIKGFECILAYYYLIMWKKTLNTRFW